jgi:hypothetical protein
MDRQAMPNGDLDNGICRQDRITFAITVVIRRSLVESESDKIKTVTAIEGD